MKYLMIIVAMALSAGSLAQKTCTYSSYSWNTLEKKAVAYHVVRKAYSDVNSEEVDKETGCTVCEEDQVEINLARISSFKVCHVFAEKLESIFQTMIERDEPIYKIVGYRVGKTRGVVDAHGNRTIFSNHSFGIAIDINQDQNGLYDNCLQFDHNCRLIRGGQWDPKQVGSLVEHGELVQALYELGFKWGGKISGKQKDFMHFSPSGY